jgi:hypothetical protein
MPFGLDIPGLVAAIHLVVGDGGLACTVNWGIWDVDPIFRDADFSSARFDIWRGGMVKDANRRYQGKNWVLVGHCVPCYVETTPSNYTLQAMGIVMAEEDMIFTLDILHFPLNLDVQSGDVLFMRQGIAPGFFWRVRGERRIKMELAKKVLVAGVRMDRAPAEVGSAN